MVVWGGIYISTYFTCFSGVIGLYTGVSGKYGAAVYFLERMEEKKDGKGRYLKRKKKPKHFKSSCVV
jgi:hypothetical protein